MKLVTCDWLGCEKCHIPNAPVLVETDTDKDDWFYEGDRIMCQLCDAKGEIQTDDGLAWAYWYGDDD